MTAAREEYSVGCEPTAPAQSAAGTDDQWLRDTREFWDVDSCFDARFRRILSDPEIDGCSDPAKLEAIWDRRTDVEIAQLLRGIPLAGDWVCVEIGCGIGRLMKPISARCRRIIGMDISPRMVAFAREYLRDVPNAEVLVNDGRSLPGPADASIDLVYAHLAFQHITRYDVVEDYLREVARVLRPGGYFRLQSWREARLPLVEWIKNVPRKLLRRPEYHGPRCWAWHPGRDVRFGGVTYHPRRWRRLLGRFGLHVTELTFGQGHDYWMWTTARRESASSSRLGTR